MLAVQATAKVVGQVAALPFKAINGGLELVKNGLDDMQGPLGPIGAGIGVASKGLHTFADAVSSIPLLGDALGPMLQAAAAVPDALKGITESLVRMSRLASPAQAKQLDMAVEDSQAVVGRSFLPLLAMITDGVRLAGDALASFLPNDREMTAALKETRAALAPLAAQIREALSTVGPIVRQKFAEVVQWIGKNVQVAVQFIEQLEPALSELWQIARQVDEAVSPLREQLSKLGFFALSNVLRGVAITVSAAVRALDMLLEPLRMIGVLSRQVQAPTGEGGRSSRNAAAREASFQSVEQYQQQLQQGAYGQAADPQTQAVTQLQMVNTNLFRIWDLLNRGISVTMLQNLGQAASAPPRLAAGALGRGVGALAGLLGVGGG